MGFFSLEDQTCGCGCRVKYVIGHNACVHLLCYEYVLYVSTPIGYTDIREKYARVGVGGVGGPMRGPRLPVAAGWVG